MISPYRGRRAAIKFRRRVHGGTRRGRDERAGRDVPRHREREQSDAHRVGRRARRARAGVRRPGPAHRRQAAAGAALPPEGAFRARGTRAGRCGSTIRTSRSCITSATRRSRHPAVATSCATSPGACSRNSSIAASRSGSSGWSRGSSTGAGRSSPRCITAWSTASSATDLLTVMFDATDEAPDLEPARRVVPGPRARVRSRLAATRRAFRTVADPLGSLRNVTGVSATHRAVRATRLAEAATLLRSLSEWAKTLGDVAQRSDRAAPAMELGGGEPRRRQDRCVKALAGLSTTSFWRRSRPGSERCSTIAARTSRTGSCARWCPFRSAPSTERGTLNNRVSGMFPGLPVSIADPAERLASISAQLSMLKDSKQAVAGDALVTLGGFRAADAARARCATCGADAAAGVADGDHECPRTAVSALRRRAADGLLVPVRADHGQRSHQHRDLLVLRAGCSSASPATTTRWPTSTCSAMASSRGCASWSTAAGGRPRRRVAPAEADGTPRGRVGGFGQAARALREEMTSDRRGMEGLPLTLGLREPVGDHPEHRGVVAQAEVAAVDRDVLAVRPGRVDARSPGHDPVEARVDGGRRHGIGRRKSRSRRAANRG